MRGKGAAIALGALAVALLWASPAQAAFGLNGFDVSFGGPEGEALEAGAHPDSMTTSFGINFTGVEPDGEIKDAVFEQVPGLAINPEVVPPCPSALFLGGLEPGGSGCPAASQVGEVTVSTDFPGSILVRDEPVYRLTAAPGFAARLGFTALGVPLVIDGGVKETDAPDSGGYTFFGALHNTPQVLKVFGSELTLFGRPAGPDAPPFLTLPASCTGPAPSSYEALSWEGDTDAGTVLTHDGAGNPQGFITCDKLHFNPEISSRATSEDAASPSGLHFQIAFDHSGGLLAPDGAAQSTIKQAVVTLPPEMTANPSLAEGIETCSPGELARETIDSEFGAGCPAGSKIGTVASRSPLIDAEVGGTVYLASPRDNPFNSLIAFYIVLKHPGLGVLIKLPAEVAPDPGTGQLITTVTDIPQIPFSEFDFRFREGARAPLITPPACGTYETVAEFTPWSRPADTETETAELRIDAGPGGGPCPPSPLPFEPGFAAGTLNNAAGAFSPFLLRLTRRDGDRDMTRFDATLPAGVLAKLAGVSRCADAQIARAAAKSGLEERRLPSCPANSRIGGLIAGAGVGSQLTYVPGTVYLAGPFGGAPLSAVAIVPAVAGPFDVGTVVYRQALRVDRRTGVVSADGSLSQLPTILAGIPLAVRDVQVSIDRPGFTLNPTSCEPMATVAGIWGEIAPPAIRPAHFQAASCQSLPYAPRLGLRLKGGTRRGAHPALRTVLRPRPGHANSRRIVVRFPRSAFVEQAHIRTVCTRVQFAASACPKGSVYGRVAAFTPLLDQPLRGPVYLRSSNNELPDLVFDLKGEVDFEAVARIDSVRGALRATAYGIPDAPIDKVVIRMQGGDKGLIVNSRNLCAKKNRAGLRFDAHSGKRAKAATVVRAQCGKGRKARRSAHRRG